MIVSFFPHMKSYKDVMSTVYFPVSERQLTDKNMKESPINKRLANVKNIENHNKLVQNISELQIYPYIAQKSKS